MICIAMPLFIFQIHKLSSSGDSHRRKVSRGSYHCRAFNRPMFSDLRSCLVTSTLPHSLKMHQIRSVVSSYRVLYIWQNQPLAKHVSMCMHTSSYAPCGAAQSADLIPNPKPYASPASPGDQDPSRNACKFRSFQMHFIWDAFSPLLIDIAATVSLLVPRNWPQTHLPHRHETCASRTSAVPHSV